MHAKIVDHPTLLRDMQNQHIVQTDTSIVRKHEARMRLVEENQKLRDEIGSLKSDVQEIKRLIQALTPPQYYANPYVGGWGGLTGNTIPCGAGGVGIGGG